MASEGNSSSHGTSDDDRDDEDDFSEEEDDGKDNRNNAPIMSIFASYYGIEDPVPETNIEKDGIDDVHFNPEKYVKVSQETQLNSSTTN